MPVTGDTPDVRESIHPTVSHDTILQKAKDIVGEGYRKAHV
jgi:hypothetical protein